MKETSRSRILSWATIDGYKNLDFYNNKKKILCSFNGVYNPSSENERFLQSNKNPIPLMGCTTQSRESK